MVSEKKLEIGFGRPVTIYGPSNWRLNWWSTIFMFKLLEREQRLNKRCFILGSALLQKTADYNSDLLFESWKVS